jgi:flagellar hook-associated protein 2
MAVDYLSALNSSGSGLNVTQIVDSLVAAEIEPQRELISKSQNKTELEISELATIKSNLNSFKNVLNGLSFDGVFSIEAVSETGFEITQSGNLNEAVEFDANLKVNQIAQRQTLAFSGYTSETDEIGDISLTISFGELSNTNVFTPDAARTTHSVTLAGSNLSELAEALSDLDGVNAEVVKVSEGNFALAVYSDFGQQNALSISSNISNISAVSQSDYDLRQTVAAQDSIIELNGITINRATNTLKDVINGVTISLNEITGTSTSISGKFSADLAKEKFSEFVNYINETKQFLSNLTKRDNNGSGDNIFAADANIKSILSQFNNLTRSPISGFGTNDYYLSELGVMTNRDGTLALDEEKFSNFFDNNRSQFVGISSSQIHSSDLNLSVQVSNIANQKAGNFEFLYDPETQTATLSGQVLTSSVVGDKTIFRNDLNGFETFSISVDSDKIPQIAQIDVGVSASQKFINLIDDFFANDGEIVRKQQNLDTLLTRYQDDLIGLDDREISVRSRYLDQFTVMEQIVTKLKSTGDYITTMMDAWNKKDN